MEYIQPDFYHFSEDSIHLAKFAVRSVLENCGDQKVEKLNILDLCCGCGVVGIEFLRTLPHEFMVTRLDFLDVQEEMISLARQNISKLTNENRGDIIFNYYQTSFQNVSLEVNYDLILCNPPYFKTGHGRLGKNDKRNLCRFWTENEEREFFNFLKNNLFKGGQAYFLCRDKKYLEELSFKSNNLKIIESKPSYNICFFKNAVDD